MHAWANTICPYAGGIACDKPPYDMCASSMSIAVADSATVTPTGATPWIGTMLPSQQPVSSGRPNGSKRHQRRVGPRHDPRRRAAPPSRNAASIRTGKFASKKRGRSTPNRLCAPMAPSPKSDPYMSTRPSPSSLAAPFTFSMEYRTPKPVSCKRVLPIMSGDSEAPDAFVVE